VKIPLDLLERLLEIAERRHINRHQAIREAIAEYVERHERGESVPGVSPKKLRQDDDSQET
jgi:predicted transcriptional regulator